MIIVFYHKNNETAFGVLRNINQNSVTSKSYQNILSVDYTLKLYLLHHQEFFFFFFAISLVATVLVQRGTMKIGTMVVAGEAFGKVGTYVHVY